MSSKNSLDYKALDIAKLFAAFFVVAAHVNPFEEGFCNDIVVGLMARIAVPFFFIASSFLFFSKKEIGLNDIKHYIKRLFVLYFFWMIFELPFMYLRRCVYSEQTSGDILCAFIRDFFTGNTYEGSYFIIALIECVPLVYFLSKIIPNWLNFIVGLVLYSVTSVCVSYYHVMPLPIQKIADVFNNVIPAMEVTFFAAYIYVVIGKIIAENPNLISERNISPLIPLILIVFFLHYGESFLLLSTYVKMSFSRIVISTLFFVMVLRIRMTAILPYKRFRQLSTIIFFSHFLYMQMTLYFYYHVTEVLHLNKPMQYLAVLLLSVLTYFVMDVGKRTKLLGWMKYGF